jgi:hypothetical protein
VWCIARIARTRCEQAHHKNNSSGLCGVKLELLLVKQTHHESSCGAGVVTVDGTKVLVFISRENTKSVRGCEGRCKGVFVQCLCSVV